MKKIFGGIVVIAIIALFILTNIGDNGFHGDYGLYDGHEWSEMSYEVVRGDADKFSAELTGPQRFKVVYSGEYDFEAILTFKNDSETGKYRLILRESISATDDTSSVDSELTEIY